MVRPDPAGGDAPETLVDVLDRLLDVGAVLDGQVVLSIAGVDLVQVNLRALVASIDTAQRMIGAGSASRELPAPAK